VSNSYYVYALKDPRSNLSKICYIGKGTGSRALNNVMNEDKTRKGVFIQEILDSGKDVLITLICCRMRHQMAHARLY